MESTKHSGDTAVAEKQELKEPSQYNVIVYNNDYTSYEEVIFVVSKSFEMTEQDAYNLARTVDTQGKGICGTYSKEIAETKLDIVDLIKKSLISIIPFRAREIEMLEFSMEKA